jgi:hypothetical protein
MRIIMKIQINSRVSESEEDEESLEDSNSESATSLIEHLNNELINLEPIFSKVEDHLSAVEKRVNQVSINSFYPLTDPVKEWCYKKGLSEPFTLEEWFQAILTDVERCVEESIQWIFNLNKDTKRFSELSEKSYIYAQENFNPSRFENEWKSLVESLS